MKRQMDLLKERYDLANRPAKGVTMSRGKPVQEGIRATLPQGMTWDKLAAMTPEEIREKDSFPAGFLPLPHPNHPEGGMVFPTFHIEEIQKQEGRDLTRFDLDFDLPDHFLPEFPPPIYLTTRPDLGDVSQGKLVTIDNFYRALQRDPESRSSSRACGCWSRRSRSSSSTRRKTAAPNVPAAASPASTVMRTATRTPRPIWSATSARRSSATASIPPRLRGVNIQRLFGSQRALKSVEDFTEFEQRAAYFDGDPVIATKKGVNILERGSQVHFMAEFQELLDFPPAPKLGIDGKLDPAKGQRGGDARTGRSSSAKRQCASCHPPPYYTDNLMHNLQVERFYKPRMINGRMASADGPIKTFPLRGIKDSPPYLHDGRLLTLEDTVEFFNLVLGTQLTTEEKQDLVAFLRVL